MCKSVIDCIILSLWFSTLGQSTHFVLNRSCVKILNKKSFVVLSFHDEKPVDSSLALFKKKSIIIFPANAKVFECIFCVPPKVINMFDVKRINSIKIKWIFSNRTQNHKLILARTKTMFKFCSNWTNLLLLDMQFSIDEMLTSKWKYQKRQASTFPSHKFTESAQCLH